MKKNNEKGFLLIEAIVVAVFVLSLFTFIFINIIPLVGKYETEEQYDTVDGAYNANLVRMMIMKDENINDILHLGELPYKGYKLTEICEVTKDKSYCTELLGILYVKKIYITWYRTDKIKSVINQKGPDNKPLFDRATRDYVDNMEKYTKPSSSIYDKYKRIIVQYEDGSFANIEVKKGE